MEQPLVLRSPHLTLSENQEKLINRLAEKLGRYFPRVVGCEVSVEPPPRSHRKGGPYQVRVDVLVPGNDLHVHETHDQTLEGAIRKAFATAKRRLEEYSQVLRHDVKRHGPGPRML